MVTTPLLCPLCKATSVRSLTKKGEYEYFCCPECKSAFLYPPVTEPPKFYDEAYFTDSATLGFGYANYRADKAPLVPVFHRYLSLIEKFQGGQGTLIDVGAATGFFVALANARGWRGTGIEISPWAVNEGKAEGINMIQGTLKSAALADASVDVLTYLDVIEHLPAPEEELTHIFRVLRSDGLLFITTPDFGSLSARLLGRFWPHLNPPEHLFLFSRASLSLLLERHGFFVECVTKIDKTFTFNYLLSTVGPHLIAPFPWSWLRALVRLLRIGEWSIPVPSRDSITIIARKRK